MATATLIAILGSIVVLYILIKGHIYVIRRFWGPVFEEEEVETDESADEESGDEGDDEEGRVRRGWDEVR